MPWHLSQDVICQQERILQRRVIAHHIQQPESTPTMLGSWRRLWEGSTRCNVMPAVPAGIGPNRVFGDFQRWGIPVQWVTAGLGVDSQPGASAPASDTASSCKACSRSVQRPLTLPFEEADPMRIMSAVGSTGPVVGDDDERVDVAAQGLDAVRRLVAAPPPFEGKRVRHHAHRQDVLQGDEPKSHDGGMCRGHASAFDETGGYAWQAANQRQLPNKCTASTRARLLDSIASCTQILYYGSDAPAPC